jgi:hypothetical protein
MVIEAELEKMAPTIPSNHPVENTGRIDRLKVRLKVLFKDPLQVWSRCA